MNREQAIEGDEAGLIGPSVSTGDTEHARHIRRTLGQGVQSSPNRVGREHITGQPQESRQ